MFSSKILNFNFFLGPEHTKLNFKRKFPEDFSYFLIKIYEFSRYQFAKENQKKQF